MTMESQSIIAEKLRPLLKPLYNELFSSVKHINGEKDTFAVQWGSHYPLLNNNGIIFVGRATNQWRTVEDGIDALFGDPHDPSTFFNCHDQMTWVYDNEHGKGYSTNRSAFWRVIRAVARSFYPEDELNHVAWSNVCKIQKHSGKNPEGRIFDCQIDTCKKIFKAEMDILSPKYVTMFVGNYGKRDILSYMNGGKMPETICEKKWDRYKAEVYRINNIVYICTEHPMRKPEDEHIRCLISLINEFE